MTQLNLTWKDTPNFKIASLSFYQEMGSVFCYLLYIVSDGEEIRKRFEADNFENCNKQVQDYINNKTKEQ